VLHGSLTHRWVCVFNAILYSFCSFSIAILWNYTLCVLAGQRLLLQAPRLSDSDQSTLMRAWLGGWSAQDFNVHKFPAAMLRISAH
jgi:hypothetical protein